MHYVYYTCVYIYVCALYTFMYTLCMYNYIQYIYIYVCSCDTVSLYVCMYINTVYVMLYCKILWKSVELNVSYYAYVL